MRLLTLLSLFVSCALCAQTDLRHFDYRAADSVALHCVKQKGEKYVDIAHRLVADLPTEQEKFRALFRWVAENLEYAEGNYTMNPGELLKQGKAVCQGYASLLYDMCKEVGIECEKITGKARNAPEDLTRRFRKLEPHAWNAVKLGGEWYLVDATWASGEFDKKTKKFIRKFDPAYFLSTPEFFSRTHYPKDKKWQLLDHPVSRWRFLHRPICYSAFETKKFIALPAKRTYFRFLFMPVKFKMRQQTTSKTDTIGVGLDPHERTGGAESHIVDEQHRIVRIWLYKPGTYYLTLFVNHEALATYRVRTVGIDPDKQKARREKRQKRRDDRAKKHQKS